MSAVVGPALIAYWPIFPNSVISMAQALETPYISASMKYQPNHLNSILFKLLQPLARLFLHFGMRYREYCELSKAAFVAVAGEDFGVHGRPTNASRIAAMTGLTRKEIARIRRKIDSGESAQTDRRSPIHEVLSAWCSVDEFLDKRGQPKRLPFKGERTSFESLVRQFAGDIPEGAMRKELQRIDVIELAGDTVRVRADGLAALDAREQLAAEILIEPYEQLQAVARRVSR